MEFWVNVIVGQKPLVAQSFDATLSDSFAELYKYQFVLAKSAPITCESWCRSQLGPWALQSCPHLQCVEILDATRTQVGWFLGIGIDADGKAIQNHFGLSAALNDADFWDAVERQLAEIAGRFAAIFVTPKGERIYFDGALDQSVVFNPQEDLVASNPALAATGERQPNPLFDGKTILRSNQYYAFDHTSDRRVKRARPNHYLDLQSYALVRHWPTAKTDLDVKRSDRDALILQIQHRLQQIVTGLVTHYTCTIPISGGRDSRLLLGMAKHHAADLGPLFTHATNHNSLVDSFIGAKICECLNLEHRVIETKSQNCDPLLTPKANRERFDRFAFRTGFESGTRDARAGLADILSPKADLLLRGNLLGMLGGQQYQRKMLKTPFSLTYALTRLRLDSDMTNETIMRWGPSYMDWMRSLPAQSGNRIYDLAFLELVQPHALGALLSGSTNSYYVNPFNDRFLLHAAMRLRPSYRISGKVFETLLANVAPELTHLPFTPQIKRRVLEEFGVAPPYTKLKNMELKAA